MIRFSQWSVPLAVIGSIFVTSVTFLQYAQAHRADQPGGYYPIIFGALAVGVLAALCSHFNQPKITRYPFIAILSAISASITFFVILLATLILCFGS